jgi:hypothetical protein
VIGIKKVIAKPIYHPEGIGKWRKEWLIARRIRPSGSIIFSHGAAHYPTGQTPKRDASLSSSIDNPTFE